HLFAVDQERQGLDPLVPDEVDSMPFVGADVAISCECHECPLIAVTQPKRPMHAVGSLDRSPGPLSRTRAMAATILAIDFSRCNGVPQMYTQRARSLGSRPPRGLPASAALDCRHGPSPPHPGHRRLRPCWTGLVATTRPPLRGGTPFFVGRWSFDGQGLN